MRLSRITLKSFVWSILVLLLLLLAVNWLWWSPGKVVTSDLIGTFHATHKHGVETLTLRANMIFTQKFQYNDGRKISNTGRWQYTRILPEDPVTYLILDDYVSVEDELAGNKGLGIRRVGKLYGRIVIETHADSDVIYNKLASDRP
jgi:hypothetical protein